VSGTSQDVGAPVDFTPRPLRPFLRRRTITLFLPVLAAALLAIPFLPDGAFVVYAPAAALVLCGVALVTELWNRDLVFPVFDIGTMWSAATVIYGVFPLLNFMAGGMKWAPESDGRLLQYQDAGLTNPSLIASFGWRYVLYMLSFVCVYLAVRGRGVPREKVDVPQVFPSAVAMLVGAYLCLLFIELQYGLVLDRSYRDPAPAALAYPHLVVQITHNVFDSVLLIKQVILLVLVTRWNDWRWRWLTKAWLVYEVVRVVLHMGARSTVVLLVLTFILYYHRLVKPLTLKAAVLAGTTVLSVFLLLGIVRNLGTFSGYSASEGSFLTSNNEFQALFATAFDLHMRRAMGVLPPVPWQIYVSDLYLEIPSQLLPFYKWDPSEWYLEVIGARGQGIGYMFGVMSQAAVGWGWIELVLRGAVLGVFFGFLHRWQVQRASDFFATLLYAYVCIWGYYTFRATTFWFMYNVIYQFIPIMMILGLLSVLSKRFAQRPGPQST
jgi:hypothetical protein